MTGDTTPQQQAAELIRRFIVTNVGYDGGHLMTVQAQELTILLGDAGLLCSSPDVQPQEQDGSLRSVACGADDGDLVDIVAEALRERPFHFGPNTRDSITRGMDKVFLTGAERRDLARMALGAVAETQKEET